MLPGSSIPNYMPPGVCDQSPAAYPSPGPSYLPATGAMMQSQPSVGSQPSEDADSSTEYRFLRNKESWLSNKRRALHFQDLLQVKQKVKDLSGKLQSKISDIQKEIPDNPRRLKTDNQSRPNRSADKRSRPNRSEEPLTTGAYFSNVDFVSPKVHKDPKFKSRTTASATKIDRRVNNSIPRRNENLPQRDDRPTRPNDRQTRPNGRPSRWGDRPSREDDRSMKQAASGKRKTVDQPPQNDAPSNKWARIEHSSYGKEFHGDEED